MLESTLTKCGSESSCDKNIATGDILQGMGSSISVAVDTLSDLLLYEKISSVQGEGSMLDLDRDNVAIADVTLSVINMLSIQVLSILYQRRKVILLYSLLQARACDVELRWNLCCLENVRAHLDVSKFSQVLRNLLSNAPKFTPAGGIVKIIAEILPSEKMLPQGEASPDKPEPDLASASSLSSSLDVEHSLSPERGFSREFLDAGATVSAQLKRQVSSTSARSDLSVITGSSGGTTKDSGHPQREHSENFVDDHSRSTRHRTNQKSDVNSGRKRADKSGIKVAGKRTAFSTSTSPLDAVTSLPIPSLKLLACSVSTNASELDASSLVYPLQLPTFTSDPELTSREEQGWRYFHGKKCTSDCDDDKMPIVRISITDSGCGISKVRKSVVKKDSKIRFNFTYVGGPIEVVFAVPADTTQGNPSWRRFRTWTLGYV